MARKHEGQEFSIRTTDPFKNEAGTATDPTAVVLRVKQPNGTTTDYHWPTPADLTRVAAGDFKKSLIPAVGSAGIWEAQWTGTGAVAAVAKRRFRVFPSL